MANEIIPPDAAEPLALHALIRKRAEIAGRAKLARRELDRIVAELDHVDATILIFDPTIRLDAIRAKFIPPVHPAKRGEIARVAFRCIREADGPITSREIALRVMEERRLDVGERALVGLMVRRVCVCLRAQRDNGRIRSVPTATGAQGWEPVR